MHDIDFYNESHEHKFHDRGVDFENLRNLGSQPTFRLFPSMQDELFPTFPHPVRHTINAHKVML